jgi:hypothetical protein
VELELVQHAGGEREPGNTGAVHEHVPVARRFLRSGHRGRDVAHVADERPARDVDAGLVARDDEDRHAVVVVAAPAARRLERPPAGDDCAGGHELVAYPAVHTRRTAWDS